jgi:hypothetical protein
MKKDYLYEYTRLSYSQVEKQLNIFEALFSSLSLDFDMQMQTQSNWCWAATSVSVSLFYWKFTGWTQCKVANAELELDTCCDSPTPSACNVPWYLDRALTRTNNFVSITGPVSYDSVRAELQAGRVVGARVGWSGGGGHFMVIYGCSRSAGVDFFDIDDPIYGKSQVSVTTFQSSYQGSGSWTHTYFTKSYIPMFWIKPYYLKEPFIKKIWEMRPLLQLKGLPPVEEAELTLPHPVYVMGLEELEAGNQPSEEINFVRVLEMAKDKLQAYYDISLSDEAPEVHQMAGPGQNLELFDRGLAVALRRIEKSKEEVELRQLRIPGLYVDAIWLHYEDPEKDLLIPLRAPGLLEPFSVIPLAEALRALRDPAAERRKMDDTMGA